MAKTEAVPPRVLTAREQLEGEGMLVHRAIPNVDLPRIDPFLLLDHMGPHEFAPGEGKGAPTHPHRGFETVTYMLDGTLQHRDSQGNVGNIGPGDVQWMTAGAGVVHSELPHPEMQKTGGLMNGLQLWVNLPAADKMMQPRYQDIKSGDIPEVEVEGGIVRVIAGTVAGTTAIIDTRTPIEYLHARLDPGGAWTHRIPAGHNGFAYVIDGKGSVQGIDMERHQMVPLAEGQEVRFEAAADEAFSVLLVDGKPLREPVVNWGPFVMNSRQDILQAIEDFQSGRFGEIPAQMD